MITLKNVMYTLLNITWTANCFGRLNLLKSKAGLLQQIIAIDHFKLIEINFIVTLNHVKKN